jgi:hypothetical protein
MVVASWASAVVDEYKCLSYVNFSIQVTKIAISDDVVAHFLDAGIRDEAAERVLDFLLAVRMLRLANTKCNRI